MTLFRSSKQVRKRNEAGGFSELLVTVQDPTGAASRAYWALRTNLLYADAAVGAPREVVLVTSSGSAEGRTTICANLGVVLAQADKKTLVIDADLRKPNLHNIFGVDNSLGVVDVLSGELSLSDVAKEPLPGLSVVSSGPIPPNPTELLSSDRFADLIDQARQLFDYVLIDSPATESVPDPMIIATQADAAVLVLDPRRTREGSLSKTVRDLEAVGANILGTVMNNVKKKVR